MSAVLGGTMPWLAYPATMALGLLLHAGLAEAGGSLLASTYAPVILAALVVTFIAMYFVFYAINGFFQHSNIKLRYGLLNYVISSAELHRWHHSRMAEQSNRNFGNNVIIWDLLFGTRFLPAGRVVGELGLKNKKYPERFVDQMLAPFTAGITDRDVPLVKAGQWFRRRLLWLRMR